MPDNQRQQEGPMISIIYGLHNVTSVFYVVSTSVTIEDLHDMQYAFVMYTFS